MKTRRQRVIDRALNGPGVTPAVRRRAAYDEADTDERTRVLLQKVARHAWKVTREDVEAVTAAGVPEDEIFELVICAALGRASRQLTFARRALDAATAPQAIEMAPHPSAVPGGGR